MVKGFLDPILLIVIPLFFVFLSAIVSSFENKVIKFIPVVTFGINMIIIIFLFNMLLKEGFLQSFTGGFYPPLSINLILDKFSIIFVLITNLLAFLVAIYNAFYIKDELSYKFHILLIVLGMSTTWLIMTGDLFNLFVSFEILSISSFSLVAFTREKESVEAGFKYLILGSVAGILVLIGIILLYASSGTLNMADIALKISSLSIKQKAIPFILLFTGLAVEGAIFPLNSWLPDAHPSAPSGVSAFLSGIVTTSAIYAIARISYTIFNIASLFSFAFVALGLVTLIFGEVSAFYQKDIKRMLAFSTIGQTGIIFIAMSVPTVLTVSSSLMQIVNHSLCKATLFMLTGSMVLERGTRDIEGLKGLGYKMRGTVIAFTVAAISLIGIPPLFGFFSKLSIITSLFSEGGYFALFCLITPILFLSIIEGAYFFKVIRVLFTTGKDTYPKENFNLLIPAIILISVILILTIFPNQIFNFMKSVAGDFLNRELYLNSVIGGMQ